MSEKEIELLRDLCRKNEVSFMLAKTIFDEYVPYLENAHKKHKDEFDKEFWLNREKDALREVNSARLLFIVNKLGKMKQFFTKEEIAALSLARASPLLNYIFVAMFFTIRTWLLT